MPAPEQGWVTGYAVVWLANGYGEDGSPTIDASPVSDMPVNTSRRQRQIRNAKGELINIDATARVDREVPIGSIVFLGTADEYNAMTEAEQAVAGYYEVIGNSVTHDVKGIEISYKVSLAHHSGSAQGAVVT